MSATTTPVSFQTGLGLVTGKFLGSHDRVLLAGNHGKVSSLQVHYYEYLNGIDGKATFGLKHDIHQLGTFCATLHLCGIPRLMKTVAAVGGVDWNSRYGFVDLINLETKSNSAALTPLNAPEVIARLRNSSTAITSIAFNPNREVLAVSNEGGEVIMFDLYSETEICRMAADMTGIIALQFNAGGQLVTVGNSSVNPVKVWDVRYGHKDEVLHNIMSMEVTSKSPRVPSSSTSPAKDGGVESDGRVLSSLTCLAVHPVYDRVICGGSSGVMSIWDLRTNATVQFNAHLSRVNDILVHPRDHNQVISCSSDGTVRQTNSLRMPVDSSDQFIASSTVFQSPQFRSSSRFRQSDDSQIVLSANFSFTSMDCDEDSSILLSMSEVGQVWRTEI